MAVVNYNDVISSARAATDMGRVLVRLTQATKKSQQRIAQMRSRGDVNINALVLELNGVAQSILETQNLLRDIRSQNRNDPRVRPLTDFLLSLDNHKRTLQNTINATIARQERAVQTSDITSQASTTFGQKSIRNPTNVAQSATVKNSIRGGPPVPTTNQGPQFRRTNTDSFERQALKIGRDTFIRDREYQQQQTRYQNEAGNKINSRLDTVIKLLEKMKNDGGGGFGLPDIDVGGGRRGRGGNRRTGGNRRGGRLGGALLRGGMGAILGNIGAGSTENTTGAGATLGGIAGSFLGGPLAAVAGGFIGNDVEESLSEKGRAAQAKRVSDKIVAQAESERKSQELGISGRAQRLKNLFTGQTSISDFFSDRDVDKILAERKTAAKSATPTSANFNDRFNDSNTVNTQTNNALSSALTARGNNSVSNVPQTNRPAPVVTVPPPALLAATPSNEELMENAYESNTAARTQTGPATSTIRRFAPGLTINPSDVLPGLNTEETDITVQPRATVIINTDRLSIDNNGNLYNPNASIGTESANASLTGGFGGGGNFGGIGGGGGGSYSGSGAGTSAITGSRGGAGSTSQGFTPAGTTRQTVTTSAFGDKSVSLPSEAAGPGTSGGGISNPYGFAGSGSGNLSAGVSGTGTMSSMPTMGVTGNYVKTAPGAPVNIGPGGFSRTGPGYADSTQFQDPSTNPNINSSIIEKYGKQGRQLPVVIRNNNPAALSLMNPGSGKEFAERQEGYVGATPRPANEGGYYAKYATPEHGVAANAALLERYGKQGVNTPDAIVRKWSTDTGAHAAYSKRLQEALGVSGNTPVDLSDKSVQAKILRAKSAHESGTGQPIYSNETFERGVNRDFSGGGTKASTMGGGTVASNSAAADAVQKTLGQTSAPDVIQKQAGIRNLPIQDNLKNQLQFAAEKTGVQVEITSGGQPGIQEGGRRTGSTRHDYGGAADLKLYQTDPTTGQRRLLDMRNPDDVSKMEAFARESVRAGATGIGAGMGYMGPSTMHIGGGSRASWGGADFIGRALKQGTEDAVAGQKEFVEWQQKKAEEAAAKANNAATPADPNKPVYDPTKTFGTPFASTEGSISMAPQERQSIFKELDSVVPRDSKSRNLGAMMKMFAAASKEEPANAQVGTQESYNIDNSKRGFGFGPQGFMTQPLGKSGYSDVNPTGKGAFNKDSTDTKLEGSKLPLEEAKAVTAPDAQTVSAQETKAIPASEVSKGLDLTNNAVFRNPEATKTLSSAEITSKPVYRNQVKDTTNLVTNPKVTGSIAAGSAVQGKKPDTAAKSWSDDKFFQQERPSFFNSNEDAAFKRAAQRVKDAEESNRAFNDRVDRRFGATTPNADSMPQLEGSQRQSAAPPPPPPPPPPPAAPAETSKSAPEVGGNSNTNASKPVGGGNAPTISEIPTKVEGLGLAALNMPDLA